MEFWIVICIGLSVLYLTGSLHTAVANAYVSGSAFVLFFLCAAALSFVGAARVARNIAIDAAGAFVCLTPVVYLIRKKRMRYTFLAGAVFVMAAAAGVVMLRGSYTMDYLPYLIGVVIVAAALVSGREAAPVYAPALMGVFCVTSATIETAVRAVGRIVWFDCTGITVAAISVCLAAAYALTRPKAGEGRLGRAAAKSHKKCAVKSSVTMKNKI